MRFLLLSLISAGCACGEKPCDPLTFTARCENETRVFCQIVQKYGFDFGSRVERFPCTQNNVCHDMGMGELICAHSPLTKCEPSDFKSTCDGDTPLLCLPISGAGVDSYVWAQPCGENQTCGATELGPDCVNR